MSFSQDYSSEIESLKAQLAEKDKVISELKSRLNQNNSFSNSDSYSRAQAAFRSAVESLQENIASTDITGMNQISSILNDQDLETPITSLVSFIKTRLNAIPRLCAQLRGHVDFLTRLAASPKLQSLFLISDQTGEIFLPETARQLLLEQAARTSKLISEYPQVLHDQSYQRTSTINTSLSIGSKSQKIDPSERLQSIQKLLSEDINDPTELSSLLLQEVLISSSLQRFATDVDDKLKQISKCLHEGSHPNSKSRKSNKFGIEEEEEELNDEHSNARRHKDGDYDFAKTLQLAQQMANVASKNQNQFSDNDGNLSNLSKSNRLNSGKSHNENEFNNSITDREYEYQGNSIKNRGQNSSSVGAWQCWAKRLYYGLTQLSAESQDDVGLRMAIEEAALTSIGTQILQNRLKSLRIQKSVMKQPVVQTNQKEVGFATPLICVISCIRIIKRAYSSNAYTTKRKVSHWSRKTVLNE